MYGTPEHTTSAAFAEEQRLVLGIPNFAHTVRSAQYETPSQCSGAAHSTRVQLFSSLYCCPLLYVGLSVERTVLYTLLSLPLSLPPCRGMNVALIKELE